MARGSFSHASGANPVSKQYKSAWGARSRIPGLGYRPARSAPKTRSPLLAVTIAPLKAKSLVAVDISSTFPQYHGRDSQVVNVALQRLNICDLGQVSRGKVHSPVEVCSQSMIHSVDAVTAEHFDQVDRAECDPHDHGRGTPPAAWCESGSLRASTRATSLAIPYPSVPLAAGRTDGLYHRRKSVSRRAPGRLPLSATGRCELDGVRAILRAAPVMDATLFAQQRWIRHLSSHGKSQQTEHIWIP